LPFGFAHKPDLAHKPHPQKYFFSVPEIRLNPQIDMGTINPDSEVESSNLRILA
jgi:hypothetical protein